MHARDIKRTSSGSAAAHRAAEAPAAGVRLLSHRPSVLRKVALLAASATGEDRGWDTIDLVGTDWVERLSAVLAPLSVAERECLYAVPFDRLDDMPLQASVVLDRRRAAWFPEFLSSGSMTPHFQPIVDLRDGQVMGYEAFMRGTIGERQISGGEIVAAAVAHDALYSFDARARTTAIEQGLPALPGGETLFVNLDPSAIYDPNTCLRGTWALIDRLKTGPRQICFDLVDSEHFPDIGFLRALVAEQRARGALISLDDLGGGNQSLAHLEALRPDVVKIDRELTHGVHVSGARKRLVGALVDYAHELGCRVVAEGIETPQELAAMRALNVDYGQGYLLGRPTRVPAPVDEAVMAGAAA